MEKVAYKGYIKAPGILFSKYPLSGGFQSLLVESKIITDIYRKYEKFLSNSARRNIRGIEIKHSNLVTFHVIIDFGD